MKNDKNYRDYVEENIKVCKKKLKEIEKIFGKNSERYFIAHENLLNQQNILKFGIPKNMDNSIPLSVDISMEDYW